ncbi:MAG: hypothetical protein DSZ09_04565 [Sulfurovum sp.]|nr:MAG: hypothetical protein DSZ09_04565 [Sulfurovum sp.]
MFKFYEYSDLQIKQKHNSKMLYHSYLEALHLYNLQFRYKMLWQTHKDGYQLLAKENLKTGKREYLGRRSTETEKIRESFKNAKIEIKTRLKNLKEKLKRDEKLNKIEGIVRAPKELIALMQKINELNLDDKLIVIGTNSLYAYEAKAGIMIEEAHLATQDIDILNRKDKGISFMFTQLVQKHTALELLQSIDKSFYQSPKVPYRFINKDGIWIELIVPFATHTSDSTQSNFLGDVMSLDMEGIQWIENARLFKETIIGVNGKSANITTIHPLEYAIYKNWLGQREDRDYLKHTRDIEQSKLITQLIIEYMPNIDISQEILKMKHITKEIVIDYMNNIYSNIHTI